MEEAERTTAGGSSSAQGDCLQGLLLQGRRHFASLLQPPLNDCAVLHPLFGPDGQTSPSNRAGFHDHIKRLRTSLRTFQEQSPSLLSSVQQMSMDGEATPGPSTLPFEAPQETKLKRQKAISLLRENALHSAAIVGATHDLDQISKESRRSSGYLGTVLNDCALATPPDGSWPPASVEEAEKAVRCLTHTCELLAKSIGMETFAEEHTKEDGRSQTLTLAASILVIDVDIETDKTNDDRWKASIRLRLSYATDNGSAQPTQKSSGHLADCLRIDIQAVADELLGWSAAERDRDAATIAGSHLARLRRNLNRLKTLDDLSRRQLSAIMSSQCSDLFAILEQASNKIHAKSADIDTGMGRVFLHAGIPYASSVYQADSSMQSLEDDQFRERYSTEVMSSDLQPFSSKVYSLSVTVDESASVISCEDSSTEPSSLPTLDTGLQYVALLEPPVLMPKRMADQLYRAAGAKKPQQSVKGVNVNYKDAFAPLTIHPPRHGNALTFDRLLASRRTGSDKASNDVSDLRFASTISPISDPSRQGVMVSRFPFASLQQLEECIKLLRRQARINEMLTRVSPAYTTDDYEGKHTNHPKKSLEQEESTNLVSLAFEEEQTSILISVPLPIDSWLLEAKLNSSEDTQWSLKVTASLLSRKTKAQHILESSSKQYRHVLSLLSEQRGAGLREAVTSLKTWAAETIQRQTDDRDVRATSADPELMEEVKTSSPRRPSHPSKERRASKAAIEPPPLGEPMMTRRRSSNQSNTEDKGEAARRALTAKRTASQAGMEEDEEESRRTSRRKS